jgi:hypothetical protein
MNYSNASSRCGPIGCPLSYCTCLVRASNGDILLLYDKHETLRWKPNGEIIVTVPSPFKQYAQCAVWDKRVGSYVGLQFDRKKRSITGGTVFTLSKIKGARFDTTSRLLINAAGSITVLDPPVKKKIDQTKRKELITKITEIFKVAYVASKLIDKEHWVSSWGLHSTLASAFKINDISSIANAMKYAEKRWRWTEEHFIQRIPAVAHCLYEAEGVLV